MKYNLAILKNETEEDHLGWVSACKNYPDLISFKIIDLSKSDWLDEVRSENFDLLLARPPGLSNIYKQMYDERVVILHESLGLPVYPSLDEILIYENKRMLSYWLETHNINHPKTMVFYNKEEALNFARNCSYPIVSKTAIGAGGSGVKIHQSLLSLTNYIDRAFSDKGIARSWGPNLRKGNIKRRIIERLLMPKATFRYFINKYKSVTKDNQKWFIILQEYIDTDFEWRCVKIGGSYFGHKKLGSKKDDLFSGTSLVSWDYPDDNILNFVRSISEENNLLCQSIDLFENQKGELFVNELQCFWGSKNPYQMIVNGKPGRFKYSQDEWIFEEGEFNNNNSYDLRLEHAISLLKSGKI